MKRMTWIAAASIAAGVAGCGHMQHMMGAGGGASGWETLFDGGSLDAFDKVGDANWRVENGLAVADKGTGFLVTKKSYKDFMIRAEFWVEPDSNSGIFVRCADRKALTGASCYEFNIWDTRPGQEYATGGIVDTAKVSPVPRAGGKWNTYEITAKGDHLISVLNGVKVAEAHNGKHAEGPVGLQRAPGNGKEAPTPIKWRKVQIKPL
jgi:hypothetical protein